MMTEYKKPTKKGGENEVSNLEQIRKLKKAVSELNEVLELIKSRNDWTTQETFKYTLTNIQPLAKRLELLKLEIVKLYDAVNEVKVIDLKLDLINPTNKIEKNIA